ncbi:Uncharacterised protein [uncultured archaeon]|nr:Uncharacterised protein [uncultured archaeon]
MGRRTSKGQASTEMLVIFAGMMAVFIFLLYLFSGEITTVHETRNFMDAFTAASTLGAAINAIYLAGDGTNTTLNLQQANVTLWIDGRTLNAIAGSSFYDWPLLTNSTASSNISTGSLVIQNSNGVISIANA